MNNSRIEKDINEDHIWVSSTTRVDILSTSSKRAETIVTRTSPILNDPSKYNVTVSRFTLSSLDIPLFLFINNQYYVSFQDVATGDIISQVVTHIPLDFNNSNFIFYIQEFIDDVNLAIRNCYTAFNLAHPGVIGGYPILIYSEQQNLISVLFPNDAGNRWINNTTGADIVKLWFNTSLYEKFSNLFIFFNGFNNSNKLDSQIICRDLGNNQYTYTFIPSAFANSTWFKMDSVGFGAANMTDIARIILITNSIPIQSESIIIASDNKTISSSNQILNILTDFQLDPNLQRTPNETVTYEFSSDLYRLIPCLGNQALYTIDIHVLIQTKSGVIVPVLLAPGSEFNFKLLFLKKGLES